MTPTTIAEQIAKQIAGEDNELYYICLKAAEEAAKQVENTYIIRLSELQNTIEILKYTDLN